jgi:hypothetical protein
MELVFGFALLILAGAVVLLFAMFGALAAQVGQPRAATGLSGTRPLADARIGGQPESWPSGLDGVPAAEHAVVLALSTSCGSCEEVASQLANTGNPEGYAIALACPSREVGTDFVKRHGLDGMPHFLDETGAWLRGQLDVQSSPVGLVFRKGRLESAAIFGDIKSLAQMSGG